MGRRKRRLLRRRRGMRIQRRGLMNGPLMIALFLLGLFVLLVALGGCGTAVKVPGFERDTTASVAPQQLSSGAKVPKYNPAAFGQGWTDQDRDGCDTRREILTRDAIPGTTVDRDRDGCAEDVSIVDPYTGQRVNGRSNIDIDHVVSKKDAWETGAWRWTPDRRIAFANDSTLLLAASDRVNRSKSDRGPDEWMTARTTKSGQTIMARTAWCKYATIYERAKRAYSLTITPAQGSALDEMRSTCPR